MAVGIEGLFDPLGIDSVQVLGWGLARSSARAWDGVTIL